MLRNLRSLLLSPCLAPANKCVLGIDPGYRNGCKWAVVAILTNEVLKTGVLYLHTPSSSDYNNIEPLLQLVREYSISVVAIGDGTASRETEQIIQKLVDTFSLETPTEDHRISRKRPRTDTVAEPGPIRFTSVNERGTSVWSVSRQAEEEFPSVPPTQRSAISIARRLINPLNELTKVDPQNLGLGMYQYDIPRGLLQESLAFVIEECVSLIGVDVNSVPFHLLRHISGLGDMKAKAIIAHREERGPFINRDQFLEVKGIGPKAFQQCAGFLRVHAAMMPSTRATSSVDDKHIAGAAANKKKRPGLSAPAETVSPCPAETFLDEADHSTAANMLDTTWIHPEHYFVALSIISSLNSSLSVKELGTPRFCSAIHSKYPSGDKACMEKLAVTHKVDTAIVRLIIDGLTNPKGFIDPRDTMTPPLLRTTFLGFEDLRVHQQLRGRVTNVTPFGVFIDIGVGRDGLLPRTSARQSITTEHDNEELSPGQVVDVVVSFVDNARQRITLSLKKSPAVNRPEVNRSVPSYPPRRKYTREQRRQALEELLNQRLRIADTKG